MDAESVLYSVRMRVHVSVGGGLRMLYVNK